MSRRKAYISGLCRDDKGSPYVPASSVTHRFYPPEVRIVNTNPDPAIASSDQNVSSIKDRLAQLEALKSEGLIIEAEYTARRNQILSQI